MSIGVNIKKYRKEKGYTQKELAGLIGVSVQAVSKWETDSGAPDISQVVPLAKALEISTDMLLDYNNCNDDWEKMEEIRKNYAFEDIFRKQNYSEQEYETIAPYFSAHMQNPEVAAWCLKCLVDLIVAGKVMNKDKNELLEECEKYAKCIFRHETDSDKIFMANLVLSRGYFALEEPEKAKQYIEKIPITFGDRLYWEAEIAHANKENDLAMQKCRESFAAKARYIVRCIRMTLEIIHEKDEEDRWPKALEYSEYMQRILDALLSGGDYLPCRQINQKCICLGGMFEGYIRVKNYEAAISCFERFFEAKEAFVEFLKNPKDKHSMLFTDSDSAEYQREIKTTLDYWTERIEKKLNNTPELMDYEKMKIIIKKYHISC